MASFCHFLLVFALLAVSHAAERYEPMVAFICNKGAMYFTKNGWVSDATTDCLTRPSDILSYCRKRFPRESVTNIVEASLEVKIPGWCPKGSDRCKSPETFVVRPYRCLIGAFQSDALVVPQQCKFDYVRNSNQCRPYDWWGNVARESCEGQQDMHIESYAMLLPCDTDLFNGVEFVCCPRSEQPTKGSTKTAKPAITVKASKNYQDPVSSVGKHEGSSDLLSKYMKMPTSEITANEHGAYELTRKAVQDDTEVKIEQVMKEWAAAKDRILNLQAVDAKEADKLNKEVTLRFQKEYFALQTQGSEALQQVESLHQQHVKDSLNEKKRVAIEALIRKIDDGAEPSAVIKYLQRYISAEQKDAEQCLRHYLHERERQSYDSSSLRQDTIDHLKLISTRMQQGMELLGGLADRKIADKIRAATVDWMRKSFLDIDSVIKQMTSQQSSSSVKPSGDGKPASPVSSSQVISPKGKSTSNVVSPVTDWVEKVPALVENKQAAPEFSVVLLEAPASADKQSSPKLGSADNSKAVPVVHLSGEQIEKAYLDEMKQQQQGSQPVSKEAADWSSYDDAANAAEADADGDYVKEDERIYAVKDVKGFAGKAAKSDNYIDEQHIKDDRVTSNAASMTAGSAVAIAGGVLAVLSLVAAAVMVVRRRHTQPSRRASYIEVAMDMSPEELHVMQMQMNGYENPTYRFLEMQHTQKA